MQIIGSILKVSFRLGGRDERSSDLASRILLLRFYGICADSGQTILIGNLPDQLPD